MTDKYEEVQLNKEDSLAFVEALEQPIEVNKNFVKAASKYRQEVQLDLFEGQEVPSVEELNSIEITEEDLNRSLSIVSGLSKKIQAMEMFMKDTGVYVAWVEEKDKYLSDK